MAHAFSSQKIPNDHLMAEVIDRALERIQIIDQRGNILYSNQCDTHREEILRTVGKNIFDFILPDYHDIARGVFSTVLSSNEPGNFESVLIFEPNGQLFQTQVIPLNNNIEEKSQKSQLLALFHRETVPAWVARKTIQQRTDELEKRLAERNQVLKEYTRYLDAGGKLNIQLPRLNNVSVVLQTLAEQTKVAMNSGFSAIYRVKKDWIEYAAGVNSPVLHHRRECLEEDGILGQLLRTNKIQFFQQIDEKTAQHLWRSLPREFNIHSLLIVPIISVKATCGILYLGYDHPAHFDNNDELMLHASIEATIDTLHRIHAVEQLERNIQAREQEISVLHDLSTYASKSVELGDLLQKSLHRIMTATKCNTGLIFWTSENNFYDDMVTCFPQTGIPEPIKLFLRQNVSLKKLEQNESYFVNDLPPDNSFACITIPVNSKGKPGCFLRLFDSPEHLRHGEVIHLITSTARQLGLSIDNALDRIAAKEIVVLEERRRMARNLHDSITQTLYAMSLASNIALKAFDRQEGDRLRSALEDITSSSLQAIKEMRLMLFELRPAALEKAGLTEAIRLRLNTVEQRSGVNAYLETTGNVKIPESLEMELYNIVSEALNNSLRHSGSRSVWVRIQTSARMVSLEIEDNGKGINVESLNQGGMGLTSMNERAQKLGGNLSISSATGMGTRIHFRVRI